MRTYRYIPDSRYYHLVNTDGYNHTNSLIRLLFRLELNEVLSIYRDDIISFIDRMGVD